MGGIAERPDGWQDRPDAGGQTATDGLHHGRVLTRQGGPAVAFGPARHAGVLGVFVRGADQVDDLADRERVEGVTGVVLAKVAHPVEVDLLPRHGAHPFAGPSGIGKSRLCPP